jgi:TRAP-type C4-dicarboxylate transport system permease small subunit
MLQRCKLILQSTSRAGLVLGIVFMLGIGAITTLNVILRIFNIAMAGFMESIEIMMIVAIMGAMSFAVFEKTQIAIDVLVNSFSPGNQRKLEIVALVASCVFWAAIGWATLDWLLRGAYTAITDILKVPMWPFQVYWLLGLLFFCLVYLTELLLLIFKRRINQ